MRSKPGFIALGLILLPLTVSADSSMGMPKTEWMLQIKNEISVPICKDFMANTSISAQMAAHGISYEKCLAVLPALADQCLKKMNDTLPAMITNAAAEKWGHTLGECVGKDFAAAYLSTDTAVTPTTPIENQLYWVGSGTYLRLSPPVSHAV